MVISSLNIKVDYHQTTVGWGTMKIMYELLGNKDIISNAIAPHEDTLLWLDEMGKKMLYLTNLDFSIGLVQGHA